MNSKTKRCGTFAVPKLLSCALELGCLTSDGIAERVIVPAETPIYIDIHGNITILSLEKCVCL